MRTLLGLLALVLAGCALIAPIVNKTAGVSDIVTPKGAAAKTPSVKELSSVNDIVAQSVAAAGAPAIEQQRVLRLAQDAYRRDPATVNRLRLATLLSALPAPLRDDAAAYALLAPFAETQEESPYAGFGALLAGQVAERLRLVREREQATRERERTARAAEKREETMRQQLELSTRAAEQREETLRKQLEALKSIERGIVEREEKLRGNRR